MNTRILRLRHDQRREHDVNTAVDVMMRLPKQKDFEVEVRPFHHRLSDQQRRTYRMWLNEIAQFTGDDAEALHEHFLKTYAPRRMAASKFGQVEIVKRTNGGRDGMNTAEMAEYMTKVQRDGLTAGATLTQPQGDTTW